MLQNISIKAVIRLCLAYKSTNKIKQFQSGRYICSLEAIWRIMSFNIHERVPDITHIVVHFENGQQVNFTENNINDQTSSQYLIFKY